MNKNSQTVIHLHPHPATRFIDLSWPGSHKLRTVYMINAWQSWDWWCTKGKGKVNRCINHWYLPGSSHVNNSRLSIIWPARNRNRYTPALESISFITCCIFMIRDNWWMNFSWKCLVIHQQVVHSHQWSRRSSQPLQACDSKSFLSTAACSWMVTRRHHSHVSNSWH